MKNHTAIRLGPMAIVLASTVACSWFGSDDSKKGEPVGPAVGGGSAGDAASIGGAGGGPTGGGTGSAAGTASNGGAGGGSTGCNALAGPAMVEVSSPGGIKYCVDRTEVTEAHYAKFLKDAKTTPGSEHAYCAGVNTSYEPKVNPAGPPWEPTDCVQGVVWTPETTPNRPVVCVDWCDAYAYCSWAGKRLCGKIGGGPGTIVSGANPSDAAVNPELSQWYNACSQGGKTVYPYGDAYLPDACRGSDNSQGDGGWLPRADVGSKATCRGSMGPYNAVLDMSGSVVEFTDECTFVTTSNGGTYYCANRGGGFASHGEDMRCTSYGGSDVSRSEESFGFRCCKDY